MKHVWLIIFIGLIILFFYLNPEIWNEFKSNLDDKMGFIDKLDNVTTIQEKKKPEINQTQLEIEIHNLVNFGRIKNNLTVLVWDEDLASIARQHSLDMAKNNYFSHYDLLGNDFTYRYRQNRYFCKVPVGSLSYYEGGENIFQGHIAKFVYEGGEVAEYYEQWEISLDTVQGWMNSPGHRENILQPFWISEGIGVAIVDDGKVYVTQNFC